MTSANSMSIVKGLAAGAIVRLKALAPYALIELILPGGSVMALLLWLYRRRKNAADLGVSPSRGARAMSALARAAFFPLRFCGRLLVD
jgi:hypothetical protein